jgi:Uma2 family endonuclease
MIVEVSEKLYTVADFSIFEPSENQEDSDFEYDEDLELIEGNIVRKGATSAKHADIVSVVVTAINNFGGKFAGEKRLGTVYAGATTDLGNPKGRNAPKPDVCFVSLSQSPDSFEGIIPVAPDLVVEVNSPSDTDERRFDKLQAYQENGVKLIWSIHMLEKFVVAYKSGEDYPSFYTLKDELDGGLVLPGFTLPVKSLFE